VLAELGLERPFLVASARWSLDVPVVGRWSEIPSHRVEAAPGADSLLAVGGGSAIDAAKNVSAQTGLPLVSVPTTYSGAEWTPGFGIRSPDRRMVGGGGGANLAAIVYDAGLTLGLPREPTVGTAMNALAHCAEALYVRGRNDAGDRRRACRARRLRPPGGPRRARGRAAGGRRGRGRPPRQPEHAPAGVTGRDRAAAALDLPISSPNQ